MRKFSRGAAALVLGTALSASATGQAPVAPQGAPPGTPPPQSTIAPLVPSAAPAPPEARPTGVAATVNGQQIQEVEVYRGLRQFPPHTWEMARKEILAHVIENTLIDQYLNAVSSKININPDPKEVDGFRGRVGPLSLRTLASLFNPTTRHSACRRASARYWMCPA
jgi:peptidyl-prolyl cis-trans isomerase C